MLENISPHANLVYMRVIQNTCPRCGETQYTEYCGFCEPGMVPFPTDQDIEEMATYYDSIVEHEGNTLYGIEAEQIIDEYDRHDHLGDG